ncbi:MAG TPA: Stp1/IreP family PP2C-type Ser/Thr phosphatase [Polyangia bacterium]|jgi:protein phosphatase|nr:Stp1/IreP family PP2C-type Ser/Thr phosphatase [Polyangia bacterium]
MPSPPDIIIEVFGKTDVGLIREHNEDNFLVADVTAGMRSNDIKEALKIHLGEKGALFLVCDGMGGAAAGEVASRMAVESIFDVLTAVEPQDRDGFARAVRSAIEVANERIYVQSRDNQSERGMGTTCTVAALVDQTLVVGQIGDSRCYVFRGDKLAQVTKDQSLAWQLIEAGAMTAEEAKAFEHANIILQALGVQERVEVVLSQVALRQGDLVVLCSDGLHGPVGDDEMLEMLQREADLQKAAEGLIQKALDRDGPDNITVVIARFTGAALLPATAEDLVTFVPYDPGPGPEADPTTSSFEHPIASTATVNERVPQELRSSDEAVTAGVVERSGRLSASGSAIRTARSVLAFFFLALVAAAAGGIFVMKCEREQAAHSSTSEGRGGKP